MRTRTIAVVAASVGVVATAATGVTYANSVPKSAAKSAPQSVPAVQDVAPVGATFGGESGSNDSDSDSYRKGDSRQGDSRQEGSRQQEDGRIQVNERSYSADPGTCIAVVNVLNGGLGAVTFNVRNDSRKTVEFFNGITCDNGAPAATVGPGSATNSLPGLTTTPVNGLPGLIVGSFRVVGSNDSGRHH
ncbi:hypothetical protein JCM4814A_51790 [Streptomyces phaeofaciens JCM 4814]|uniref:Secreted protein n=1 Tax=Streptomyces phaeofaciens TaxID=68254 RepID=A0A918HRZ7_9ACTN|nr:hypothetical protein [Streptomyces phaeofaciens]GGU00713.1 hypothetical protein GCM10010226_91910 [Streptomyces phaeofaciens]